MKLLFDRRYPVTSLLLLVTTASFFPCLSDLEATTKRVLLFTIAVVLLERLESRSLASYGE